MALLVPVVPEAQMLLDVLVLLRGVLLAHVMPSTNASRQNTEPSRVWKSCIVQGIIVQYRRRRTN